MTHEERTVDAVFAALADEDRRSVLAYLQDAGEATVEELSTAVDERASDPRGGTHGRDALVRLHHVHLPKLSDAGLVEYDRTSGQVEYVGGSAITELLATAPDEPHPESH